MVFKMKTRYAYVIAFSTDSTIRIPHNNNGPTLTQTILHNEAVSPLFIAAIVATEEAILNSLFMAETMKGKVGRMVEALPVEKVKKGSD